MFEHALETKQSRKPLFAIVSLVVHLALGGLLLVLSLWEVHEIQRPSRGVAVANLIGLPPPSGGGEAKATPKRVERKPEKRIVRNSRQPSDVNSEKPATDSGSSGAGEGDGEGPGTGIGPDGPGTGGPGLGIGLDLCMDPDLCAPPPVPVAKPPQAPKVVPAAVLGRLHRIAGEAQIGPPSSTRNAMSRKAQHELTAILLLCLDKGGAVNKQHLIRSSGYPEYDSKLLSGVRRWRYQPYRANGKPVAICTQLTFRYQQE